MAKISSLTVFVWSTLTLYILLGGLFVSYAETGQLNTPAYALPEGIQDIVNGNATQIGAGLNSSGYAFSEGHNITFNGADVSYSSFSPPKKIFWHTDDKGFFELDREGYVINEYGSYVLGDWWYAQVFYYMNDTKVDTYHWLGWTWDQGRFLENSTVQNNFDSTTMYSSFKADPGTEFECVLLFFPATNSLGDYAYGGTGSTAFQYSMQHGVIGLEIATNSYSAFSSFNIGFLVSGISGALIGFAQYGCPLPISFVLGGIFYTLLALGIAKLIIG